MKHIESHGQSDRQIFKFVFWTQSDRQKFKFCFRENYITCITLMIDIMMMTQKIIQPCPWKVEQWSYENYQKDESLGSFHCVFVCIYVSYKTLSLHLHVQRRVHLNEACLHLHLVHTCEQVHFTNSLVVSQRGVHWIIASSVLDQPKGVICRLFACNCRKGVIWGPFLAHFLGF